MQRVNAGILERVVSVIQMMTWYDDGVGVTVYRTAAAAGTSPSTARRYMSLLEEAGTLTSEDVVHRPNVMKRVYYVTDQFGDVAAALRLHGRNALTAKVTKLKVRREASNGR